MIWMGAATLLPLVPPEIRACPGVTPRTPEPFFRIYFKFYDFLIAFSQFWDNMYQFSDLYPQGNPLGASWSLKTNYMVVLNILKRGFFCYFFQFSRKNGITFEP